MFHHSTFSSLLVQLSVEDGALLLVLFQVPNASHLQLHLTENVIKSLLSLGEKSLEWSTAVDVKQRYKNSSTRRF